LEDQFIAPQKSNMKSIFSNLEGLIGSVMVKMEKFLGRVKSSVIA
jgi:hypothetical protein